MTIYKSTEGPAEKATRLIGKLLEKRECAWNERQKEILATTVKEKFEKKVKSNNYTNKLLGTCKTWGGPVVNTEELQDTLSKYPDLEESIVRNELSYYRNTHQIEVKSNPDCLDCKVLG